MSIKPKGEQLKMFMRPGEIMEATGGRSVDYGNHPGVMAASLKGEVLNRADRQLNDNEPPLSQSVLREGVKQPVILTSGGNMSDALSRNHSGSQSWMGNGHHRVASAMEAERVTGKEYYVPVIHDDDFMGSSDAKDTFGIAKD